MSSCQSQEILDLRLAERRLDKPGDPARRDQGVKRGDRGREGRGRDRQRMGQQDHRPETREGGGDHRPPGDHLQAGLGARVEEPGDKEAHDGERKEPAGKFAPDPLLGNPLSSSISISSSRCSGCQDVTRPHDRHDPGPRRVADGVGHIEIPLVDQGGLKSRQFLADGLECQLENVVLL